MRIGIDFDNTIINYNQIFHDLAEAEGLIPQGEKGLGKDAVKQHLLKLQGNDLGWQSLQAKAYGPEILRASLFEGFQEFLDWADSSGHQVFVVSQKSVYSHFDSRVPLRDWAYAWLSKNLNQLSREQVFFEATRSDKLKRIGHLQCDVFIDDLAEVLEDPSFPESTVALGFGLSPTEQKKWIPMDCWKSISSFLRLAHETGPAVAQSLHRFSKGERVTLDLMKKGGNNRVYRVREISGKSWILKQNFRRRFSGIQGIHSVQERDRCQTEQDALVLLAQAGFTNIPISLFFDQKLQFALHSDLPGKQIEPEQVNETHIAQLADFVLKLSQLSKDGSDKSRISSASDARFSFQEYLDAFDLRLIKIRQGCPAVPLGDQIVSLIENRWLPLRNRVVERLKDELARDGLALNSLLPQKERILSPSDFGFHNVLVDENLEGRLSFLDFEYFGWDDPAKLIADFFHSAAFKTPWMLKWNFLDQICRNGAIENTSLFVKRWEKVVDLVGLEWVLIILNVVSPGVLERKLFADPDTNVERLVESRLLRAHERLDEAELWGGRGRFLTIPDREQLVGERASS